MVLALPELVDDSRFQFTLDRIVRLHRLPTAVVDDQGVLRARSGWPTTCPMAAGGLLACPIGTSPLPAAAANASPVGGCVFTSLEAEAPVTADGERVGALLMCPLWTTPDRRAALLCTADGPGVDPAAFNAAAGATAAPSADDHEAYVALVAGFVDQLVVAGLAERRQREAEQALGASHTQHRAILETAIDGFWLVDMEGRLLEVNETYARMSGYTSSELLALRISDLEAQESRDVTALHMSQIAELGHGRFESRHRRKDGTVFDVEVGVQHRDDDGGQFVAFIQDISERRRSQAEAAQQYDLLTRLARLVPGVLYQYRLWPDGRSAFPYSSPGMTDIYEVTPEEVREDATPVFGRIHPDDLERVGSDISASARTLETFYADFRVVLPRQGLRWRWSQAVPERLEDDSILWHGIILDNTQRKLAEQEAERLGVQLGQAQKMESVGRLAGGVAHDFNNMLSVILGTAELALEDAVDEGPLRLDLLEIQGAARQSAGLTRQLLAFARHQPAQPEHLDLSETVPGSLTLLRRLIGEHISLVWQPSPGLWPVWIDPSQLDQIVANLVINARDAITGIGSITVSAANEHLDDEACAGRPDASPGDYVCLSVADTGSGIAPEAIPLLFEPFYTTKALGKGTGLGLATAYGSARGNGGFITVSSLVGAGTTFGVWFPRAGVVASASDPRERVPRVVPRGRETVLVVEDEPALLGLIGRVLREQGYTVLAAATPGEALQVVEARREPIDLLLTDVVMPEMSGPDMAERLLVERPGLRVLFMSGYVADAMTRVGELVAATRLVEKPFVIADLLAAVRDVLDET